jgi:hypothetical protein
MIAGMSLLKSASNLFFWPIFATHRLGRDGLGPIDSHSHVADFRLRLGRDGLGIPTMFFWNVASASIFMAFGEFAGSTHTVTSSLPNLRL